MSSSPALFSSYANLRFNSAIKADEKADTYETASGQGYNGRLCDITQLWQSESEPGECFLTGQTAASRSLTKTRFGNNSFLVRRNVFSYSTDKKTEVQLEIQSETLQDIIGEVAPHLRSTVNLEARPIIIKAPYHELYHFRDEIAAANLSSGAFSAKQDLVKIELETLQKFIVEIFGRMIPEIEAFKSCRKISMEYLWAIFKPGEPVLLRRQDPSGELETCCGILQSYFDDKRSDGSMIWCLRIRYMSLEGGRFGVVERQYEFDVFLGQMDISTLPAYPLKYCTHPERTKIDLARRGKVFIDLCRNGPAIGAPTHKTYNGPVWIHRKDWEPDGCKFFDSPERTIIGRVMIDPVGYIKEHAWLQATIATNFLFEAPKSRNSGEREYLHNLRSIDLASLSEEELMTFPSRIGGYSLVTKDAGFFLVDRLKPVVWEEARVEHIRESTPKLQLVLRVASGFSFSSGQFNYEIEKKGRGLVFLLYGPSGTGKTLTAECVAEILHIPLYRMSGSDLGIQPWEVEKRLTKAFNRTARWKAMLLFDEADAFMAARGENLERNSMVSILLRLLEYQSGIVILTSNRRMDFDSAFHTRIHVSMEYSALNQAEKEAIWRWEMEKAELGIQSISNADISRLGLLELDGRTIKNVVHVLKLFRKTGSSASTLLLDLKQVLEVATGSIPSEARRQVQDFCYTD